MAIFLQILGVAFILTLVVLGLFAIGIIVIACVIGNAIARPESKEQKNKRGA